MVAELADWLLRSGLALAVAIALVLALRPLWRRWLGSASVLWLWLLLPAALVATSWPRPTVVQEFVIETAGVAATASAGDLAPAVGLRAPAAIAPESASVTPSPALAEPALSFGLVDALATAWWLGALWMLLRLLGQQRAFLRRLGPLNRRADGSFLASTTRIGPAVVGALRPRIVLPADFEQRYDARQQALVLAHERCHLRRGDLQVNLLASAMRCVFWFNPLVHLAASRLRVDQELACDAAVLRNHPDAGRAYATALLNTQLADLGLPVGCYWQSSQSLKWRIAMLKRPSPGTSRLLAGAVLALLASSATAASLWQLQPVTTVSLPAAAPVTMVSVPVASLQVSAPAPLTLPVIDPLAVTPAAPLVAALVTAGMDPPANVGPRAETDPMQGPPPAAVEVENGLVPPRVVEHVNATHPYRRSRSPEEGFVLVVADIGADGRLVSADVPDEAVTPVYRELALRALEAWVFEPARQGGAAVAATVVLPVHFSPRQERDEFRNGIDPPGISHRPRFPGEVRVESAALTMNNH